MQANAALAHGIRWAWAERILFLVGLAVVLHPVLSSRFYWTLDGPSHAYAASLLHDLILGIAPVDRAWELNPVPVPNSLGHFLLALLMIPFQAPEALKVLHVLLLASIPLLLRAIAKQSGGVPWSAHLAFPFTIALPFVMGYYNLCLGISLLLAVIWQWQRMQRLSSSGKWVGLSVLLLLLYFAHALPFVLALFWIALHMAYHLVPRIRRDGLDLPAGQLLLNCALSALPALVCMIWYMIGSVPTPAGGDYPYSTRLEQLWRPFILAEPKPELVLWAAAVAAIVLVILLGRYRNISASRWNDMPIPGFILLLCLVLALCFSRNVYGNGGDVLFRLALMLHLIVVVLLPSLDHIPRAGVWIAFISLAILSWQTNIRGPVHEFRTDWLREAYEVTQEIPAHQSVAVISFDWEQTHVAELGLIGRHITVRSNYELVHDHFPIWNKPEYTRRALALPVDPLDLLSPYSNIRGADLRNSDYVIITAGHLSDHDRFLIDLVDQELVRSHLPMPPRGMMRIHQRKDFN